MALGRDRFYFPPPQLPDDSGFGNAELLAQELALQRDLDLVNGVLDDQEARLVNLESVGPASGVTQAWESNLNDLYTVPRALLLPNSDNKLPTFKPLAVNTFGISRGHGYYAPIVVNREGYLDKFRWISGDNGAFTIDEYWLALYVYDPADGYLKKVWHSPNLNTVLQQNPGVNELYYPMNLGQKVTPGQVLFCAHQQRQPAVGGSTRPVAAVPQSDVGRPDDVLLRASVYRQASLVSLPNQVLLSDLEQVNTFVPWWALSLAEV
ncbi:hypothetical protein SEA_SAPO_25 [Gordonia phage Sapo]|nr:hypothetical protein SEA_SAPO_25 [Gordonia phage Sapo]